MDESAWTALSQARRWARFGCGMTAGGMFGLLNMMTGSMPIYSQVVAIAFLAIVVGIGLLARVARFRCPTCGGRFAMRTGGLVPNPVKAQCLHCGSQEP